MAAHPEAVSSDDARITAALWFAERGFGVFSCWSARADGTCRCPKGATCTSPGKHPIPVNGFDDATTDATQIRVMLAAGSHPNYGLLPPEGVFVWDVDGDDWEARLAALEARHGPLPPTLRTSTAHGLHIFLRWPDAYPRPLRAMFGWVTRWGTGPQGRRGYVIGPRSIHPSGKEYAPSGGVFDIATLPEAWAAAALAGDHDASTVRIGGGIDPTTVAVGGRHDFLRDQARFLAGSIRDPEVLFAAVWAINEKLPAPKTRDEVMRAIGDALVKFPADPVEQDPETGDLRRVPTGDGGDLLSDDVTFPFPDAPDRAAYGGLAGEVVAAILDGTDASEVGLLASLLALCGALVPARAYFGRAQMTAPHIALVGESSVGRKGTAMTRAVDTLSLALGTDRLNRLLLDGINSGEGLVTDLESRQRSAVREPTAAVVFEEEYANLLAAAGRDGSSLDAKMRQAFDGGPLSNRKASSTQTVAPPYWLPALVGITPTELQDKGPAGALTSGSANRWLWLPVQRRDVDVVNEAPDLPLGLRQALWAAHEMARETPPELASGPLVSRLLTDYGKHLVKDATGLAKDLSRRYPVIAFRIGLIHAALDRSGEVTEEHVWRGIALTEYARQGAPWVFGYTVGNELATLILRHLREVGSLTRRQITQDWARDPVKRQRALDELRRLGFAEVVKVGGTGGRKASVLQLVQGSGGFVHYVQSVRSQHSMQSVQPPSDQHGTQETHRTHETGETHGMHGRARNRGLEGSRTCPACHLNHPVGTTCKRQEDNPA